MSQSVSLTRAKKRNPNQENAWQFATPSWQKKDESHYATVLAVLMERDPSAFVSLWRTCLWQKVFWKSFKFAHWHNTLFWIAILYTTWSPAIACWIKKARCFEFRCGEVTESLMSKFTFSFDKVSLAILNLKLGVKKISALLRFENQKTLTEIMQSFTRRQNNWFPVKFSLAIKHRNSRRNKS